MNLSQIQSQLCALLNRRDFTANPSLQMTFIGQATQRINRELRCPAMEKTMIWTVPDLNPGVIPIPPDFLELIDMYDESILVKMTKVDITKALKGSQPRTLANGNTQVTNLPGPPTAYARQGAQWLLTPTPAQNSKIVVEYWAELTPLVNPTDTNQLSTIAWDLMIYAALVQAGIYYKDVRLGTVQPDGSTDGWEGQYQKALTALQDQSDIDDENGAAVVVPTYTFPLDWEFLNY